MKEPIDIEMMRDYNEMMALLDGMGIPHIPYSEFKGIWLEEMNDTTSSTSAMNELMSLLETKH